MWFSLRNCLTVLYSEMDVADVETLVVVAQLYELINAPAARALRCYTAALTLRPSHVDIWLRMVRSLLGCIECMRCKLLLPMIAVSVRRSVSLSVTRLNSAAHAVCAGSFGAAFAKSLWPRVLH